MSKQPSLFDTDPTPWDLDDAGEQCVATVVFTEGLDHPLDYSVPDKLRGQLAPGQRVRVPLGRSDRLVEGYCVSVESRREPRRLKPVRVIVDDAPIIGHGLLKLTRWMADHYLCPWGQVLETVVPAGVRSQAGTRDALFLTVPTAVAAQLAHLKLPEKQARVLRVLASAVEGLTPQQLAAAADCTQAPINALRAKGLVDETTRRVATGVSADRQARRELAPALNDDQKQALATIMEPLRAGTHATVLIHGVTGSGKTEVYIQAIQEVVSYGRQAIVLVPEISLTPQTEGRFRARFDNVALLHSHLSNVDRNRHWQRIAAGDVQVVVGARSAVFAPTPNLGLIILDEEHESSFKQGESPRYHARDVALERTRLENIPLVLGSATPSLESWYRATSPQPTDIAGDATAGERYRLVSMPRRVFDRPLPLVGVIDLRNEYRDRRSRGAISRPLRSAMEEALRDDGQVILLLNRRGFSTHVQCPSCGQSLKCPECSIALTHHLQTNILLCHYCDHREPAPQVCPECNFPGIQYGGLGTQRLEAEVRAAFSNYRCLRMDTDTMQQAGSHEKALSLFREGEVKILLGTQMIAKGLDFPNVTLVGVINADTALHLPDFRAAERTFQLVTQVAGRTGRGDKGGRVLVQTFSPEHPAIMAAVRHDYEQFARHELPIRAAMNYPPMAGMVRMIIRGPAEGPTHEFAKLIAERLRACIERDAIPARVLGPAPAPISKLRGKLRFQIQAQSVEADRLRAAVAEATADLKPPDEVQWVVDIDPIEML